MKKRKTTIRKKGQGFEISFSEKDGKDLAKHVRDGGSLLDNFKLEPGTPCDVCGEIKEVQLFGPNKDNVCLDCSADITERAEQAVKQHGVD